MRFRPGPAVRQLLIGADASAVRWVLTTRGHGDALVVTTVEAAADMADSPPQPDPHSRMYIWLGR